MNRILSIGVSLYRRMISPMLYGLGVRCRFHPCCSEYALDALKLYPWPRAIAKIAWRIARCGPWSGGGFDPVTADSECGARDTGCADRPGPGLQIRNPTYS